ncbi:WAT1-related protein At1g68170-like [Papaver somniferum]|uniref:WAT1-related protein At1g68170-like n=1 Tax=Papaver somniferum TaxID=3469 RepID=UPI000E6FA9F5|nr:WAT1-related protein At1g68170-like [Papaver somniferum]
MNVFYRLAINDNMNMSILIAYRSIFGAAFIIPIALIKEKNVRPKLTWTILFQAFFCGLLGLTIPQNLYTASMNLTSATIPAAMANLSPAMTFILAIIFRLEALKLGTMEGKLKVLGTTIGIGGAMLVTFYKGVDVPMWQTHFLHVGHHQGPATDRPVLGSLLAILSYMAYSSWLIIQGIVHSGMTTTLIAWCVNVRGPLFVSIFNPVGLVLVAFAATILLNEKLHLGTVIGSVLIAIGLYFVLWGKSKEMKKMMKCSSESEAMKVVVSAHP